MEKSTQFDHVPAVGHLYKKKLPDFLHGLQRILPWTRKDSSTEVRQSEGASLLSEKLELPHKRNTPRGTPANERR
jgi:hypothetical protein